MQVADIQTERARRNRLLATGLFAVSMLVLGLMFGVVFGVRSGVLPRLVDHLIRAALG